MSFKQFARRDDLPGLGTTTATTNTDKTTTDKETDKTTTDKTDKTTTTDKTDKTTTTDNTDTTKTTENTDKTTGTTGKLPGISSASLPGLTTSTGLPGLSTSTSTSAVSTPSIGVPRSDNNPYLIRQHNPNGTVFIAVGAIVGAILAAFALFHLIVTLRAARTAKKSVASEKSVLEKYRDNNNLAYGGAAAPFVHSRSVSIGGGFGAGASSIADSSIYGFDEHAASKSDVTKMFFSPTADVMQHKRMRSSTYLGSLNMSTANLSQGGWSNSTVQGGQSKAVPNVFLNSDIHSELSSQQGRSQSGSQNGRESAGQSRNGSQRDVGSQGKTRKTIPSMYLEDLLGDE